jgi:hypothetical protein
MVMLVVYTKKSYYDNIAVIQSHKKTHYYFSWNSAMVDNGILTFTPYTGFLL